jgi:1-acyl-sn-glycerol-3-phosphate acyltransferase
MSFLRKIWAFYAVFLFLFMMALSVPYLLLMMALAPGKRALRRNIYYLHHVFTPVFLALIGVRRRIHGRDKFDRNGAYVLVGNHRSALDFIVNADAFPGVFRYLAKQELHKVPVFGWVVKKMCVTVDRRSAMSRARSIVEMRKEIADGWSIFIYPEGGRNRTDEPLAPFFDGAFRLAIETRAPILVQTLVNIRDVTSTAKSVDLWPGTLDIVWDGPIETRGLKAADIPALKEQVRAMMIKHLGEQVGHNQTI